MPWRLSTREFHHIMIIIWFCDFDNLRGSWNLCSVNIECTWDMIIEMITNYQFSIPDKYLCYMHGRPQGGKVWHLPPSPLENQSLKKLHRKYKMNEFLHSLQAFFTLFAPPLEKLFTLIAPPPASIFTSLPPPLKNCLHSFFLRTPMAIWEKDATIYI